MYRALIKNLHPFFKPDDDDGDLDINAMLFGNSSDDTSSTSDEDLFAVPEIDGLNDLKGDDLDAALAAMLAADNQEPETPSSLAAADTSGGSDSFDSSLSLIDSDDSEEIDPLSAIQQVSARAPAPARIEDDDEDLSSFLDNALGGSSGGIGTDAGADIDALLASLGGGDDSAPLSGAVPEPEIQEEVNIESMDLIDRMLAVDKKADSTISLKDIGESSDTAARFDPFADHADIAGLADDEADAEPKEIVKPRVKKSFKQMMATLPASKLIAAAAVVLIIILGSGVGVAMGIRQVYAARHEYAMATAHIIRLSQPVNVPNDVHFITTNQLVNLGSIGGFGGQDFFLRRIALGQRGTFLFFEDVFNPDDYYFVLRDQNDNFFMRITNDIEYCYYLDRRGTTLQFSPLRPDTSGMVLYIQERVPTIPGVPGTQTFHFTFEESLSFPAAVHVNNHIHLFGVEGAVGSEQLTIAHAVFSNTSSEIVYMVQYAPDGGSITFGDDGIRIRDGARIPVPNRLAPMEFAFPEFGRALGRITFGPVRNLDSDVFLTFRDVYRSHPLSGQDIDIQALFRDALQYEQRIALGNNTLVLERMGVQGPFVILVFHGLDQYGRRTQMEIDADLLIHTDDGIISIRGQNFFSERAVGTDLFFNTVGHGLDVIRTADLSLDVRSVNLRVAEGVVDLNLNNHNLRAAPLRTEVEYTIKSAFSYRLAYRSGILGLSNIRGFSTDVLHDRAVMRLYTPLSMPGNDTLTMYDVHIVVGAFVYSDLFLAVVEEEWVVQYDGLFSSIRNTHQVVLRQVEDNWIVVNNRVLS